MKEITIIPAIMPLVNWGNISTFFRDVGIPDPLKILDTRKIKISDPDALIQGLQAPEHCFLSFFIYCPNCSINTILAITTNYDLFIKTVDYSENNVTMLMSGNFLQWKSAILSGCTEEVSEVERIIFNKIYELIESTNLRQHFKKLSRSTLNDGSFILCS